MVKSRLIKLVAVVVCAGSVCSAGELAKPVAVDVASDAFVPAEIAAARYEGYLGDRIVNNAQHRLMTLNLDDILASYVHRPGQHAPGASRADEVTASFPSA